MVPCFNQGSFAAPCIDSLHRQTYRNWKAVLLDDCSTDGISGALCEALAGPQVSVVRLSRNRGRALVRNEGVRRLGAVDYILMLDGDDYLSPSYIAQLVRALEATPEAGLAYGLLHYFDHDGPQDRVWPTTTYNPARRYLENVIPGPGVLFRSTALAATAGWRADFTHCSGEDYDIWLQVVERGWRPIWVQDASYHYRQHSLSFLAQTDLDKRLDAQMAILKYHHRAIRRTVGIDAYLSRFITPALVAAIRAGDCRRVVLLSSGLLRWCPVETVRNLTRYYGQRAQDHLHRKAIIPDLESRNPRS